MSTTVKNLKEFLKTFPDDVKVEILYADTYCDAVSYFKPLDMRNDDHLSYSEQDNTLYIGENE